MDKSSLNTAKNGSATSLWHLILVTFSFKDHEGNPSVDYHPKTKTYYNYLNKIGFNLSSETGQWADQCDERTEAIQERPEHLLHSWFNFV